MLAPHFVNFSSFERYVGITFMKKKGILAFHLTFSLEYEKQLKKNQNITYLFLAIHLATLSLEMFL